ncbi:hypothetical protein GGF43_001863 [Coemansia sp. RSA 2618]|nr:hypothetical protein GGF43_001863 [Coemansia sp. RSA 2618]
MLSIDQNPFQPRFSPSELLSHLAAQFHQELYLLQGLHSLETQGWPSPPQEHEHSGYSVVLQSAATEDDIVDIHDHFMFNFSHKLEPVLTIMAVISPNPRAVPWFGLVNMEISAHIYMEDIFELAKFLPCLKALEAKDAASHPPSDYISYTTSDSSVGAQDDSTDNSDSDAESFENIEICAYEIWMHNKFSCLYDSVLVDLYIQYSEPVSAQCIGTTERLCEWYFPQSQFINVSGSA